MFIYNVTVKISWSIQDAWLRWMQQEHIPDVVGTGCFTHAQLVRLLEIDEKDGPTYAAQYFAPTKSDYNRYIELYSSVMRQKAFDLWEEQFVAFRTLMQVVE